MARPIQELRVDRKPNWVERVGQKNEKHKEKKRKTIVAATVLKMTCELNLGWAHALDSPLGAMLCV